MTARQSWGGVAALSVLTLWAYMPVRHAGFVYEDLSQLRDLRAFACCGVAALPRALVRFTWWFQAVFTPTPLAFHAANILLHGLVVALVYRLARRLGLSSVGAWAAAGVFLVHPIQVEAVAYVTGRTDLLAAIGVTAACVLAAGAWWTIGSLAGIVLAVAVALLAKESAVAVLVLLPLTAWACGSWAAAPAGRRRAVLTVAAIAAPLVLFKLAAVASSHPGESATAQVSSRWSWVLLQATAMVKLLTVVVWPFGQTVDYDHDLVPRAQRVAALALVVALGALVYLLLRRRHRTAGYALAGVLLPLLPRFAIPTPRSYINAHQFYQSMVGVALLAGLLFDWLDYAWDWLRAAWAFPLPAYGSSEGNNILDIPSRVAHTPTHGRPDQPTRRHPLLL